MDEAIVREISRFWVYFLIALGLVLVSGWPVGKMLDRLNPLKRAGKPEWITGEQWKHFEGQIRGGDWIGGLERTFFFVAILIEVPELVAGWLVFKVASKWDVWANVYQVPQKLTGVDDIDFLIFRANWGARTYQRFIVGMLGNILVAIVGVAVFRLLVEFRPCICP